MVRLARITAVLATLTLAASLAACSGTKVLTGAGSQPGSQARIKGDVKLGPLGNAVAQLEQVDGHALGRTQSQALVAPGQHSIGVRCSVPARNALAQQHYTFTAEAGHTYRLQLELLSHPPGCATSVLDTDTDIVVAGPHVND